MTEWILDYEEGGNVRRKLNELKYTVDSIVESGKTSTSGTDGTSGIDGTSGTSGSSGTSGTSGSSGSSGTSGIDGTSGSSGTGFNTVTNYSNNRILKSDGTTNGAYANSGLTFDGLTLDVKGNINLSGDISIIGGTETQFLKADGSLDSTIYSNSGHNHNKLYQPNNTNPFVYTDNTGTFHIDGNIIQSGITNDAHFGQIYTNNDYILLRSESTSGLSNSEYAGLEVIRYDGLNNGRLAFDKFGVARVGDVGYEQPLSTREETPTDKYLSIWNSGTTRFETINPIDLPISYQTNLSISGETYNRISGDTFLNNLISGETINRIAGDTDTNIVISDNIINNVSTSKHGFVPKLSGDNYNYFNGDGDWIVPSHPYSGLITHPIITDNYNGTITVGSCVCMLYSTIDFTGNINNYTISGSTLTPTNQVSSTLCVNYNNGLPIYTIENQGTVNWSNTTAISTIYRDNNILSFLDWNSLGNGLPDKTHLRFLKTQRFAWESGLSISESNERIINIDSGKAWNGVVRTSLSFSSSSINNCTLWYHSGGTWTTTGVTQYNNLYYDNGANLNEVADTHYVVNWVYRQLSSVDNEIIILLNSSDCVTESEAKSSQPPTVPIFISTICFLIGKIIVQKNASASTSIESAFSSVFVSTPVTNHSSLSNLDYDNSGHVGFLSSNNSITGSTRTKITYDYKGLIINGEDATTADINDSENKKYVTDIEKVNIGYLTGITFNVQIQLNSKSNTGHTHYQLYQPNGSNPFVYTDNGGTLHIDGNITQSGSTYETHSEQIYTTKDYILLRSGATVGLSNNEYTGIEAINYDGVNNGRLVFDKFGVARVGDVGFEQPLSTREENPINNYLAYWNSGTTRFETVDPIDLPVSTQNYNLLTGETFDRISGDTFLNNLITILTQNITNNYVTYTGATSNVNLGNNNLTSGSFIKTGGTSNQFLKADGSSDITPYVSQNGGVIYHTTPWINIGTVSTSGVNITGVGTAFTSGMVGAKIIINSEERIIVNYVSATSITVNLAFSVNYNGIMFSVYNRILKLSADGSFTISSYNNGNSFSITSNSVAYISTGRLFYGYQLDTSFSRSLAGVLSIDNGTSGNYRDLALRYVYQSIGTSTGDSIGDIRQSNQASTILFEKCTVANVEKGNGTWVNLFKVDASGNTISNSFIKSGGTSNQFLKADGSSDITPYVSQNGGIIYHTTPWINTGTVSTSGVNITGVGTAFSAAMIGAKIIINSEERIIATYISATSITVGSPFSINYNGFGFGVYNKWFSFDGSGNAMFFSPTSGINSFYINTSSNVIIYSKLSMTDSTQSFQKNTTGIIEINNNTLGNYRDLALRYVYQSITTAVGDAIGDIRHSNQMSTVLFEKCTVANATKGSGTWVTLFKVDANGNIVGLYNQPITTVALPGFNIDMTTGEEFSVTMGTNQALTIMNPIIKKPFKVIMTGGTLATSIFSGYTSNWIYGALQSDYVPLSTNYLQCEIRSAGQIYLWWGM